MRITRNQRYFLPALVVVLALVGLAWPQSSFANLGSIQVVTVKGTVLPPEQTAQGICGNNNAYSATPAGSCCTSNIYMLNVNGREVPFRVDQILYRYRVEPAKIASSFTNWFVGDRITVVGSQKDLDDLKPCQGVSIQGRLYDENHQLYVGSVQNVPDLNSPQCALSNG